MLVELYEITCRHIPRDGKNHNKYPYYSNKFRQLGISECPSLALVRRINLKAEPIVLQNLGTLSRCGHSFRCCGFKIIT